MKALWISALALLFICVFISDAYAIDIDSVVVNEQYMLDSLLSDQEILVVQVDRSRGQVKVRFEDGSEDWVHPDRILSHIESYMNDAKDGFEFGYKAAEFVDELLSNAFEDKAQDELPFGSTPEEYNAFKDTDPAPDGYNGCFANFSIKSLIIEYYFAEEVFKNDSYEYVPITELRHITVDSNQLHEARLIEEDYETNKIVWKVQGYENYYEFKANRVNNFDQESKCLINRLDKDNIIVFNEDSHDSLGSCRKYHDGCERLWQSIK